MASLVLGGIGGFFFGPIGFAIGSAIGGLFDQSKSEGPRLTDKHLQGSSYGEAIPIVYGTMCLAGQVIWAPDLVEHKHDSGGKGGPKVTTYTYTGSFDVLICESVEGTATEIIGCTRIWADGTLIYDTTAAALTDNSKVPVTFYYGHEDQQPDATEEAVIGVGDAPAYRGYCRAVFSDWDLGTFGNRIPSLVFEVFSHAGVYPWQVSVGSPWKEGGYSVGGFTYASGVLTVTSQTNVGFLARWAQFDIDLNQIGVTVYTAADGNAIDAISSNGWVGTEPGVGDVFWEGYDGAGVNVRGSEILGSVPSGNLLVAMNGNWYGVDGNPCVVTKTPEGGELVATAAVGAFSHTIAAIGGSDTGDVYVMQIVSGASQLYKYDSDLNLIHHWAAADLAGTKLIDGTQHPNFWVYKNQICFDYRFSSTDYIALVDIDPTTLALTDSVHGPLIQAAGGRITNLSGGLFVNVNNGIFSLDPPLAPVPLSDIVGDISDRSGLIASQYDVSQLIDLVPGYLISRQSSGRDNIAQLRSAYFFDAVESSAAMRFVKRGLASIVTIPDSELAGQAGGRGTSPPLATVVRTQETDLPATIYVTYFNTGADWLNGTQYSRRLVTKSQADARIDLSVALDDQAARAISAKLLWAAWLERSNITILTARKYAYVEPTDVVTAHGYMFRVEQKNSVASDIVQLEGPATMSGGASVFNSGAVGVATSGNPTVTPPSSVASLLQLFDLNLVTDADAANGFYAAMYPAVSGTWPGGTVYESSDGGTTYVQVGSDSTQDIVGTVAIALGDFGGGNIFDQSNTISVVLTYGGTLSSASRDAVLNNANMCLIGSEILQFTTATLTAPNTYTLAGLLRGRRGTEHAMATHGTNEPFVLLPTTINIPGPFGDLGAARKFKGITTGGSLSSAIAQDFENAGNALRCYSPVHLGGGRDAAGDIVLQWTRRTRIGGAWLNYTDVPLSETTEAYTVTMFADSMYSTIVATYSASFDFLSYTAAQQTIDFGGPIDPLYWSVRQLGSYAPGYESFGVT